MAKTCTLNATAVIVGDGQATMTLLPPTFPVVNAVATSGGEVSVPLAAGDNTIAVPTGQRGLWVIPPAGSVVAKKMKILGADTGLPIDPVYGLIWYFPVGTTSLVINAASIETVLLQWL